MKIVSRELKRQKDANRLGLRYYREFSSHRENLTAVILENQSRKGGRLCLLGAGNCYDVDLDALTQSFDEVHLVDIDPVAIKAARGRLDQEQGKKVFLHAPVDVSGANDKLQTWRDLRVSPEALMDLPEKASTALGERLSGPFDCVVSTCVLSQILLTYRRVLGEKHQLFQAGLITLLVTHFRVLAALTKKGGQALFITDVTTNEIAPLEDFAAAPEPLAYLQLLARNNQVFNYLNPELLGALVKQDPALSEALDWQAPESVWLWQNTPERTFLVYAARLMARGGPAADGAPSSLAGGER
jgi:hypothetical protein